MSLASPLSLILISFPFCLLAAAITDLQRFIIPNWTSILLAISFFICAIASGLSFEAIAAHLAVGAAGLAVGFTLFALGLWGAGDGKLLAAAALWFDPIAAASFVLYGSMAGGVLGAVSIAFIAFHANFGRYIGFDLPLLARLRTQTPYGVAIAAGAMIALPESDLFRAVAER